MSTPQFTPEWAKGIVWYQIFPERFRNGDPSNDPTLASLEGAYPRDHTSPWQVHPWTSDWYQLQPYERQNGRDFWFNVQRRRYGGNVQGILDRLDYLTDLGVEAIYLNPVFDSPSSHKYDGATYHHIDPHFGPDPAGDRRLIASETPDQPATWLWTAADRLMLRLIDEVHRRGLRLIFDGVWNHVGVNCWAFRDVVANQCQSAYADWLKVVSWDDAAAGTTFDYKGWFGARELPEWFQDEDGIVAGPRDYIYAATRRWMDPDGDGDPRDGIDGWRLDVAFCVRHPFWKAWRRHARAINPEAYLVAEVVSTPEDEQPYLRGDEFDATMNYNFTFACVEFFVNRRDRITASAFDQRLRELREAHPAEVAHVMQNLLDSHDANRLASFTVNPDLWPARDWHNYHRVSKVEHTPTYDTRRPVAAERRLQRLMVIFQMTYLGAPMIYYGDEAGMWGANDPDCRKPMVWPDLTYEPEATLPDGQPRPQPDEVAFDRDLFDHYRTLIHIRKASPALRRGDYRTLLTDDARRLFAFARETEEDAVVVALNADELMNVVELEAADGTWVDVLNGEQHQAANGRLSLTVPPLWGAILRKQ
ncbi:glycoside hydrolase family 13 protein [Promineifilum sp.]|uniref:glycoside hydrolase family 13 protein n=1 Tax=Promineifilum sp. TaxID=2664178 RepID=UPI0035AED1AF